MCACTAASWDPRPGRRGTIPYLVLAGFIPALGLVFLGVLFQADAVCELTAGVDVYEALRPSASMAPSAGKHMLCPKSCCWTTSKSSTRVRSAVPLAGQADVICGASLRRWRASGHGPLGFLPSGHMNLLYHSYTELYARRSPGCPAPGHCLCLLLFPLPRIHDFFVRLSFARTPWECLLDQTLGLAHSPLLALLRHLDFWYTSLNCEAPMLLPFRLSFSGCSSTFHSHFHP